MLDSGTQAASRPAEHVPAFQLDLARSVRLHPRLAVFVGLAVFVLVVGYGFTRKPMYEAQSLSYVEPLSTKLVSDGSQGIYDPSRYDSYIQQQIQTATREDILEAAIAKLPAGTWQEQNESLRSAVDRLSSSLKVQRVGTSYQLSISLMGDDPQKTAAIVNAVTDAYLDKGRKDENARSDGRLQLLQEESQRIQAELQQDRQEQAELSRSLGVADTQVSGANPYDMQLAGVRTELVAAREAHDVAAAQLASVTSGGASEAGLKSVADEALNADTGLAALKTTINQRRAILNSQMAGLTQTNPVYKQDADEIADLDRQLEARTAQLRLSAERRVEDKLRLDLRRTGDVEARLNGQLAQATAQAGSAAPKLQRAAELTSDITRLQARYSTVDDALRGLQLESNGPGTAHLLVAAEVPTAPAANHKLMLLGLALPLGIFAGLAAAILARKRDPRIYTGQDVEIAVGAPPLCVLPVQYEVSDSVMSEYLLRLAAGLERGYRFSGARSFLFTAVSEESDISALVAAIQQKLAELGFKAVAIEAEHVRQTAVEERRSRNRKPDSAEMDVHSLRAAQTDGFAISKLERLKLENTFVLIIGRPLLTSADAEYAVSSADATLLVVESGATTGAELKQCALLLQRLKASGVGSIVQNLEAKAGNAEISASIELVSRPFASVSARREPIRRQANGPALGRRLTEDPRTPPVRARVVLEPAASSTAVAIQATPAVASKTFLETPKVAQVIADPAPTASTPAQALPQKIAVAPPAPMIREKAEETPEQKRARLRKEAIARVRIRFSEAAPVVEAPMVSGKAEAVAEPPIVPETSAPLRVDAVAQRLAAPQMLAWGATIKTASSPATPASAAFEPAPVSTPSLSKAPALKSSSTTNTIFPETAKVTDEQPPERTTLAAEDVLIAQNVAEETHIIQTSHAAPPSHARPAKETVQIPAWQPAAIPTAHVIPWAPRPERRRKPRELEYPRGLDRAVHSMTVRTGAPHHALGGPRLTEAEQAVARSVSYAHNNRDAKAGEQPATAAATHPRRWGLLSQFDTQADQGNFATDTDLRDRAAG
jgi:uncharacterized protein involved in exopolysaccharide biosynthesis